jgi:MFS family permease
MTSMAQSGPLCQVIFCVFMPLLRHIKHTLRLMWTGLLVLGAIRGTCGPLVFPAMIIIVNQAVTERAGFWNGVMSSVGAVARAAAPFAFGYVFTLSTATGHLAFPFDASLPFFLSVLSLALTVALVTAVPLKSTSAEQTGRFSSRLKPWTRWRRWDHRILGVLRRGRVRRRPWFPGAELGTTITA